MLSKLQTAFIVTALSLAILLMAAFSAHAWTAGPSGYYYLTKQGQVADDVKLCFGLNNDFCFSYDELTDNRGEITGTALLFFELAATWADDVSVCWGDSNDGCITFDSVSSMMQATGDWQFDGDVDFLLDAAETIYVDGQSTDHTSTDGLIFSELETATADAPGQKSNVTLTGDVDGVAAYSATVTGYASGGTSGNHTAVFAGTPIGDNNDTDHEYSVFRALDFTASGGTNTSFGSYVGAGYDYAIAAESGNVLFADYAPVIFSLSTSGAGHDVTVHGGDAASGDTDGGITVLYGGAKSGTGADGYVKIGSGAVAPDLTLGTDGLHVEGDGEIDGDQRLDGDGDFNGDLDLAGTATIGTATVLSYATASEAVCVDGTNQLVSVTGLTCTEFAYIGTLTSNAQDQFNAKAPIDSPAFTTTVGVPGPFTTGAVSMTFTTNAKTRRTAVAPIGYLSATAIETAPPFSAHTCAGLTAGTAHVGSTEGYTVVDDAADSLLIGFNVPPLAKLGLAGDLDFEFDILEVASEEVNVDIRFFEYGNTTPIATDTVTVANGAVRAFVSMDTHTTGIGDLVIPGGWYLIEVTPNADTDDFNIFGIRATYSTGIQNNAS